MSIEKKYEPMIKIFQRHLRKHVARLSRKSIESNSENYTLVAKKKKRMKSTK